jgi:hypothetical protein
MEYSTKLAKENNWLDYDSFRRNIRIFCFIVTPTVCLIIILYLGTNGFTSSFHIKDEVIGIIFGLAIVIPSFYYVFKKTEPYEKGFVHKSYKKEFGIIIKEYLNANYIKDEDSGSFKSPNSNYKIIGLYDIPNDNLKIQVQSFCNPPLQKEKIIDIRIGTITDKNYKKAKQLIKSVDGKYFEYFRNGINS